MVACGVIRNLIRAAYGSEIACTIVNRIVAVVVRTELSVLDCELSAVLVLVLVLGGGEVIPGSCISPAKVERANIKVKTIAAQNWRKCFIVSFSYRR